MDRITVNDRRRTNAPSGGTAPPVFSSLIGPQEELQARRPTRTRAPNELRKIFLKTGLVPSASGSAYYELEPASNPKTFTLNPPYSSLKISCAVHGPKPLPRSSPFSPHLVLSTHVKFAPFAARQRRGYIRDSGERDLGVHLESALRAVVIGERWPKSGVDVVVTILEGEEDRWWGDEINGGSSGLGAGAGWGMMGVLAGCITVACAAVADAGIDCVDLVSGGVAALVKNPNWKGPVKGKETKDSTEEEQEAITVLDPCPSEHPEIVSACVVGYLQGRDEITELWIKGEGGAVSENLVDRAVQAAMGSRIVLAEAVKEGAERKFGSSNSSAESGGAPADVVMT